MLFSACASSYRLSAWCALVYSCACLCYAQPFDCPNITEPTCWVMPAYASTTFTNANHEFWKCDRCTCGYNNYRSLEGGECMSCTLGGVMHGEDLPSHIVMPLSTPTGTSATDCSQWRVCEKGYYYSQIPNGYRYPSTSDLTCALCESPDTRLAACSAGQSVGRCTPYANTRGCANCTYPPIANATSMMYGLARMLPDCAASESSAPPWCAHYLTPTWSLPTCEVVCRPGFLNANGNQGGDNWISPTCVQCATSCDQAGYDLPSCAVYEDASSVQCRACLPTAKALNAHWVQGSGCAWQCNDGYYRVGEACRECVATACGPNAIFLGCGASDAGRCLDWTTSANVCVIDPALLLPSETQQYLEYFIWSRGCTLRTCSRAVSGVSYVSRPCARFADAEIRACDPACAAGSFRVAACGANGTLRNLQCQACSAPPAPGRMLTRACADTLGGDAQYGPCTAGLACDARGLPYNCTPPRLAVTGICVCPPAMMDAADGIGCVVIPCADGRFPNPITGACSPCTPSVVGGVDDAGAPAQLTVAGVMGPTACACAPGFFMNVSTNACWRCGNLMCDAGQAAQSDCPGGRSQAIPQCECQLPSGGFAVASSTSLCEVACEAGFTRVPASNVAARARVGSLVRSSGGTLEVVPGAVGAERVLVLGDDVVVWVANHGVELWGAYRASGNGSSWSAAGQFDATSMLLNMVRVGTLTDLHIVSHDAWDLVPAVGVTSRSSYQGLWVVFTFMTDHCGETTSATSGDLVPCTSIERFIILTRDEFPQVLDPSKLIGPICAGAFLCALYPINSFGGSAFVLGDARWSRILATASLTMGVIGYTTRELIFWSAVTAVDPHPVLVQYRCEVYAAASGTSPTQDDTPVQWSLRAGDTNPLQCAPTSLAFANSALYGFAPCLGILEWPVDSDVGLGAGSAGALTSRVITSAALGLEGVLLLGVFQMLPVVRSTLLSLRSLGAVGSRGGTACLLHLDLVNGRAWQCPEALQPPSSLSSVELARLLALNANTAPPAVPVVHMTPGVGGLWAIGQQGVLRIAANWDVCGVDRVSYDDHSACEYMQCVKLAGPGGGGSAAAMTRVVGDTAYTCLPGFRTVGGSCVVCEVGSYCVGGVAFECGISKTTSGAGASSWAECLCKPGFYTYASGHLTTCLPCSANAWCMGGHSYPVPCAYDALTLGYATSPLDCRCVSSTTYGLRCATCDDHSECYALPSVTHTLTALVVSGWGPKLKARAGLDACLASLGADSVVYDMPHLAPMYNVLVDTVAAGDLVAMLERERDLVTISISQSIFAFGWVAVVQDLNATVMRDGSKDSTSGVRECMERSGATSLTNVTLMQAPLPAVNFLAARVPCGKHITVDLSHRCTQCEPGYEARYIQHYLTCVPCANGTVRVEGSSSELCVPCADNNSYAPSMGMSACVCKPGFYLPLQTNASDHITLYGATVQDSNVYCVPGAARNAAFEFFSVPMYALLVAGGVSVLLMLSFFLVSMCLV